MVMLRHYVRQRKHFTVFSVHLCLTTRANLNIQKVSG